MDVMEQVYQTIAERREEQKEGSYTCYLFEKGLDKILKKCGEECTEMVIAAKNNDREETIYEISDLVYHTMVMMVNQGITVEDIAEELRKRNGISGNLKTFHETDKNS